MNTVHHNTLANKVHASRRVIFKLSQFFKFAQLNQAKFVLFSHIWFWIAKKKLKSFNYVLLRPVLPDHPISIYLIMDTSVHVVLFFIMLSFSPSVFNYCFLNFRLPKCCYAHKLYEFSANKHTLPFCFQLPTDGYIKVSLILLCW